MRAICDTASGKKSTTQPQFKESLFLLIKRQDTLVRRTSKRNSKDFVHSGVYCGVGHGLVLCCRTCGREYIDENPLWAVKWPGHYFQWGKICSSHPCSQRRLELKELHLLRTPGINPRTLEIEGFDPDYVFRICLRTQDEISGLEQVIESWCILCKERTIFSGNRTRFTDDSSRYTLGRTPLHVERRPDCF